MYQILYTPCIGLLLQGKALTASEAFILISGLNGYSRSRDVLLHVVF